MQATQRLEPKFGLPGVWPTINADERQRPLGKAYRLILSSTACARSGTTWRWVAA
jgi:hypothetical protein